MKTLRPKPGSLTGLKLTPEEGFVLSRIDGRLSTRDLVALTGIEEGRVEAIVTKLAGAGAVVLESAEPSGMLPDSDSSPELPESSEETTSLAEFAAALGMDPSSFAAKGATAAREAKVAPERTLGSESMRAAEAYVPPEGHPIDELIEVSDEDEAPAETAPEAEAEAEEAEAAEAEEVPAEEGGEIEADEKTFRALFASKWQERSVDIRVSGAKAATGADLIALCFDPDPRVLAALTENTSFSIVHARLLAVHHHTTTGLEILTRRQDLLRDAMVERRLLKNPQAGDIVLGRVMNPKRLLPTYKIAIDREVPELTRVKSRGMLRTKFQSSPPEERADLVLRTEGRCLILMTGCTFDAKTTQILCGRPYNSVLFIQNLAKWPATPPGLLAHLCKQPFVKKSAPLRKLLLQHPNLPGEAKRGF